MKQFVSVSCGPIRHPNSKAWKWMHIDHQQSHNPDICCDVTKDLTLSVGENSIDAVENTHGLEHYDYPQGVIGFLNQAFQSLKPNGIIRIAVPDLRKVAEAYVNGDSLHFIYGDYENSFMHHDLPAERFWMFMHLWEHRIAFDYQLLLKFLSDAGFASIRQCAFNDSDIDGWHWDRYESESLYVEARKPA